MSDWVVKNNCTDNAMSSEVDMSRQCNELTR